MSFYKKTCFIASVIFCCLNAIPCYAANEPVWPEGVKEITYLTSADSSMQPALFFSPDKKEAVPLLVVLHTWSGSYKQTFAIPYAKWCVENKWAFIHPNFRGPNTTKESTCSELAIRDIISAVDYAKKNLNIDVNRIYLTGFSGGGCASLVVAGRFPEIWAGISVWVPVTDLKTWYFECKANGNGYADNMKASCGGIPGDSLGVDFEYKSRSPLTFIGNISNIPLDINAGIHDTLIPISHSLNAFNLLALKQDAISEEDIRCLVEKQEVPLHMQESIQDPLYGDAMPLFRRTSGCTRITIFDGGHNQIPEAGLAWLAKQHKK